jgi:hypothetical protein
MKILISLRTLLFILLYPKKTYYHETITYQQFN